MKISRFGLLFFACCLSAAQLLAVVAMGQPYRRNRPRATATPSAAQRSNSQQLPAQSASSQSAQRAAANASSDAGTQASQSPPPVVENADPEARAKFLELIGANWIWSPAYRKDHAPVGDCYFRKSFQLKQAEIGQVHVACDNQYELYVNGQLAGRGADWRNMDVHDITKFLTPGENVVAIKATNTDSGPAGLVARVLIKERGNTFESYSTDATWRTSVKHYLDWAAPRVRDDGWLPAKVYGPLGAVLPWGDEVVIAEEGSRFLIDPEFVIERLVTDEQAGSLIAMAFNASGHILASQEGGPLLLLRDTTGDGKLDSVEPYCNEIKNVQGILPLGNRVFAVGDGPQGGALYQMTDQDGDGKSDSIESIQRFRGVVGEHGPHTVRLGPDGLLYVLSGNLSHVDAAVGPRSPHTTVYEGDLVRPRYEDPQGHAVGVPAPGGTIIRTDMRGSFVERVAGGFRNPYDFAFDEHGELFTYDADMEWDLGTPWYRPTRVNHVPPGGEFGWRSGWAKWPEYYIDSLPGVLDVGIGSPTGVVYYDHTAYPERLQKTLFIGDWATGKIHAVKLERSGATYTAKMSTFVKGRPLNVTGLDVGPDGALYFSTGGRGTDGGIYRVRWAKSSAPDIQFNRGVQQALEQPQLHSDWARSRIAAVKRSLGDRWQQELERILANKSAPASDRQRALDLLTYFGPPPSPALLIQLSRDSNTELRVRAARLMGARGENEFTASLVAMLSDPDPWVRRVACEAIAHRGGGAPVEQLVQLLADDDRFVAFAARRALEKVPSPQWQELILTTHNPNVFLQGATGLLVAQPSPQLARHLLSRCDHMIQGNLDDKLMLDLLRVIQLALVRGEIDPQEAATLSQRLLRDYPSENALVNRELVKLLAHLEPPGAAQALARQLESDIPTVEKLQLAAYAARLKSGWETSDKMTLLLFYETSRDIEGGHSVGAYLENFARDFFVNLNEDERRKLIAAGERFPASTLSVLAKLPENPSAEILAEIRELDQRLEGMPGEPVARLRVGIVAVLGGSGETESLAYLRNLYYHDPERRAPVAMSLTQEPEGDNWPILVDSLRTVDGQPARTILAALAKVNRRPETSEPYRNAILLGLRLKESGGELAVGVLERWIGQTSYAADAPLADRLAAWQSWYAEVFPNELPAELPKESQPNKWSYEELLSYLEGSHGKAGDPARGEKAFHDAQCINCHRFNGRGEGIGPDLTTVAQRFQRKEILESIVYPNQVVSDQYASQIVIADGKTYTGIVAKHADGSVTILQSDSKKVQLAADAIEEMSPSKVSAMPEGLLNRLTLEQVADLFAYMMSSPSNMAGRTPAPTR